ncbi:MAG: hypothetical protein KatS3mg113_0033 [Planctomycetaceae bacterium]|nr:MAG: hypothetical protein KatS3mg113_0033 [Planctomycetaceae bacterium]
MYSQMWFWVIELSLIALLWLLLFTWHVLRQRRTSRQPSTNLWDALCERHQLPEDIRHRLRGWAAEDQVTPPAKLFLDPLLWEARYQTHIGDRPWLVIWGERLLGSAVHWPTGEPTREDQPSSASSPLEQASKPIGSQQDAASSRG